jgi:hypothetical protein
MSITPHGALPQEKKNMPLVFRPFTKLIIMTKAAVRAGCPSFNRAK